MAYGVPHSRQPSRILDPTLVLWLLFLGMGFVTAAISCQGAADLAASAGSGQTSAQYVSPLAVRATVVSLYVRVEQNRRVADARGTAQALATQAEAPVPPSSLSAPAEPAD
jgi:hypothetical protein